MALTQVRSGEQAACHAIVCTRFSPLGERPSFKRHEYQTQVALNCFPQIAKSLQEAGSRVTCGPALHRSLCARTFSKCHQTLWEDCTAAPAGSAGLKGRREKRRALLMPSLLSSGRKVLPRNCPADSRMSPWQELGHTVPQLQGREREPASGALSPGAPALTWEGSPGRSPHLGPWRTLTFVPSSGASLSEHLRQIASG